MRRLGHEIAVEQFVDRRMIAAVSFGQLNRIEDAPRHLLSMEAADFDRDGFTDILASSYNDTHFELERVFRTLGSAYNAKL